MLDTHEKVLTSNGALIVGKKYYGRVDNFLI